MPAGGQGLWPARVPFPSSGFFWPLSGIFLQVRLAGMRDWVAKEAVRGRLTYSCDELLGGKLRRIDEVTKVFDLNGCCCVFWQDTAYSETWRMKRVICEGRQGHKACYKAWKKLWAPKLSQKELFNTAGHGLVNNMNPCFFWK